MPAFRSAFLPTLGKIPAWIIVAAVAVCARAATFGNPLIHVDEDFYYATAHEMWRGAIPYVDIWDRKPLGLFLLYMPAAWLPLPWGTLAYQAMATASLTLTGLLVRHLAIFAGLAKGALAAAVAYVLWPNLLDGAGGQAPVFYNLLVTLAVVLIVTGESTRHRRYFGCGAMTLIGIALQVKYSVVFEGIFFGCWLLWRDWIAKRSVVGFVLYGLVMVLLAVIPTVAVWLYYAAIGHADDFVFANFISIQQRSADPVLVAAGNVGTLILILSPIAAMAFGARGQAVGGAAIARRFVFIWLVVAFVSLAIFRPWFNHYGIAVLPAGCICAAGFFGNARFRARLAPALIALVAIGGQVMVNVHLYNRGNAAQLARLASIIGQGPGCLYIYSGSSMPYVLSERCYVTRFFFASTLVSIRDGASIGMRPDDEMRRIFAQKPAVVTMRLPFSGENLELRSLALQMIGREYRLTGQVPMGTDTISVYKRAGMRQLSQSKNP